MREKKSVGINLISGYVSILGNLVTGVLMVPLYLQHLSTDDYGSYILALSVSNILGLLEFGLSMVATNRLANLHAQGQDGLCTSEFLKFNGSAILHACVTFCLSLLIAIVASNLYPGHENDDLRNAFIILSLSVSLNIPLNCFGALLQSTKNSHALGIINSFSSLFAVVVAIVAFTARPCLTSIALASLSRSTVSVVSLTVFSKIRFKRIMDTSFLGAFSWYKQTLRECMPIFSGNAARILSENGQSIMIGTYVSTGALAILTITQKPFFLCSMILAPVGSAIYPSLIRLRSTLDSNSYFIRLKSTVSLFSLLCVAIYSIVVSLNGQIITSWVGSERYAGGIISFSLGFAGLIISLHGFLIFLAASSGEYKSTSIGDLSYSILGFIFTVLFLKRFGIASQSYANVLSCLISMAWLCPTILDKRLGNEGFARKYYQVAIADFVSLTTFLVLAIWIAPSGLFTEPSFISLMFMVIASVFLVSFYVYLRSLALRASAFINRSVT